MSSREIYTNTWEPTLTCPHYVVNYTLRLRLQYGTHIAFHVSTVTQKMAVIYTIVRHPFESINVTEKYDDEQGILVMSKIHVHILHALIGCATGRYKFVLKLSPFRKQI